MEALFVRKISIVTVARSDYGIYRPVLKALAKESNLEVTLWVSGMHLSPEFGLTYQEIEQDGFSIEEKVEMLISGDSPEAIGKSIGLGVIGFSQVMARSRPDILVVLGDRFEMYAAALASLPFQIPLVHIHGGEVTEGAIDDSLRHSLTKLSHFHFVSCQEYRSRVIQLGEEPWRVMVSGAPGLDSIQQIPLLEKKELEENLSLSLSDSFLLVTFHPVTKEYLQVEKQIDSLLEALEKTEMITIFTLPNADTKGRVIIEKLQKFAQENSWAHLFGSLGSKRYFSLMALATAMVGNSSSGIIEAPSFSLPVVNIGSRQKGRLRAANVIDVGDTSVEILEGIKLASSASFRSSLEDLVNPYGQGNASEKIVKKLQEMSLDDKLLQKKFYNIASVPEK